MGSDSIQAYFEKLSRLLLGTEVTDRQGNVLSLEEGASRAVRMLLSVGARPREGKDNSARKVVLVGNGGSAAIVSHMQNDLCKAVGVRAMVLTEPPLLTALANDHGYASGFERLVELWADPGDILLAISSSGQSENILRAVEASVRRGCDVITFSGFRCDNALRRTGDLNFYVPDQAYGHVEVAHNALVHFLTDRAVMLRAEVPRSELTADR